MRNVWKSINDNKMIKKTIKIAKDLGMKMNVRKCREDYNRTKEMDDYYLDKYYYCLLNR